MKRLIAKRPIQYGGRIYEPGAAIPAHDPVMVSAWLGADTVEWSDETAVEVATDASDAPSCGTEVIDALSGLGVNAVDDNGAFVGAENLEDQLCTVFARVKPVMVLNADQVDKAMNRDELDKLAADMKLDISGCNNKNAVAQLIAAALANIAASLDTGDADGQQ